MSVFYKKKFLLLLCLILTVTIIFNNTSAVYYEITWDNTKTPGSVAPLTQFSIIAPNADTTLFAGAANGRLYLSTDDGDNWAETQPAGNVDKNWSSLAISEDGQILFASVYGGRMYSSINGGDNWVETQPAGNVDKNWSSVSISDSGDLVLASVYGGRLYSSFDIGDNWSEIAGTLDGDFNWSTVTVHVATFTTVFAAEENGRMYLSNDLTDDENWFEVQPAGNVDKNWSSVTCATDGQKCLAAVDGGRVYRTTNGGFSWAETRPAGDVDETWSSVGITDDGLKLFATASLGRVYYSSNSGTNWDETQPNGDADKDWSAIAVDSNESMIWAADKTNVLFSGVVSVGTPVTPDNFEIDSNTSFIDTFNDYPLFEIDEVQNSGTSIFSYAHGTVKIGNKIYLGTRTTPAKIVVFNDIDNLSDYTSVTVAGLISIENMTYDSVNNRIYALGTTSFSSQNLKIYSINPDNINDYTQVVNNGSLLESGSSAIVTDGEYVYGITNNTTPKFFKFRISDWSLIATNTWTGGPTKGHAGMLYEYSDRTELYFGASQGTSAVAKVDPTDLSYEDYNFGSNLLFTDDLTFRYIDETGGIIYVSSEINNLTYSVDTRTMTASSFAAPMSYGSFNNGDDLYIAGIEGYIAKFIDYDLDSPRIYKLPGEVPNEMFFASGGRKFFTNWSSPGYLKEYEETSDLVDLSTVILSWDGDTPGVNSKVYISTNGTDYTQLSNGRSPYTFSELIPGTQYWAKVISTNGVLESTPAVYTFTTQSLTIAPVASVPILESFISTKTSIFLTWSSNNAEEYLIKLDTTSSGWTPATSYTFSNLTCETDYLIKVKAKNSDNVQTDYNNLSLRTRACVDGGTMHINNIIPRANIGELDFIINNGELRTNNREINITMNANPEYVKGFSISLNSDFSQSSILPYSSPETTFTLPNAPGTYTVYLRYYSTSGESSNTISKSIHYTQEQISIPPPPDPSDASPGQDIPSKDINSPSFFKRNLMYGMWGNDVKQLQIFLNKNNFLLAKSGAGSSGKETQFFGRLTRAAVSAFQKTNSIVPTIGNFGPITRALINEMVTKN